MLWRFSAFGLGFITGSLMVYGVLTLSSLHGAVYEFESIEDAIRTGQLNTHDEFSLPRPKVRSVTSYTGPNGVRYGLFRYAHQGAERELLLYIRSGPGDEPPRLFGAQLLHSAYDHGGADMVWLALNPEAMNEFITFQAGQIQR